MHRQTLSLIQTLPGQGTQGQGFRLSTQQIRCISQGQCSAWVVLVSSMIANRAAAWYPGSQAD